MKIFPSLASAEPMNLGDSIRRLEGYPYLHLDIEDGNFVPNITFGMKTVRAAASICTAEMDAHLMVTNPEDYLEELAAAGVEAAAFHIEATGYPMRLVNRIHQLGMKAGIALNPCTDYQTVLPYLEQAEYILLMSSEPDRALEAFQEHILDKIRQIKRASEGRTDIVVDGGIGSDEYYKVKEAGATGIVMGRTIFRSEHPLSVIESFHEDKGEMICR